MALIAEKTAQDTTNSSLMLDLLNQILKLEYSLIVHYPRLAATVRNHTARQDALQLGSASVRHADTVAKAIVALGGTPEWYFEPFPDHLDTCEIFQQQLEKEKLALDLHRRSALLAPTASLRDTFVRLSREEQGRILIVKNILFSMVGVDKLDGRK